MSEIANQNSPEPLLTVADLTAWLRLSESAIRKAVCYGRIPYLKLGRKVLFRRQDIERWIADSQPRQMPEMPEMPGHYARGRARV